MSTEYVCFSRTDFDRKQFEYYVLNPKKIFYRNLFAAGHFIYIDEHFLCEEADICVCKVLYYSELKFVDK